MTNKETWSVYSTEREHDHRFVEVVTKWGSEGPMADTRRVLGAFATQGLAEAAARKDQLEYDRIRRSLV